MTLRQVLLVLHALCLGGLIAPFALGYTYSERLATRPSLYPVAVADQIAQPVPRPRRTVVAVLDGLGYKDAQGMRAAQRLRERGQCWKTDVGPLPMSRPVYAVLSTGVEQDRGGALSNDATTPHAAVSLWEIGRAAGLTVAAVSELSWWQDLFPRGFTSYLMPPRSANYFALLPQADLALVHPVYIDETGHQAGAGSAAYRAAVGRADDELTGLLDTIDLSRDLFVLTADHGHSLGGGHGGAQERVAKVLTCFAGRGVQGRSAVMNRRMITLAPALTLLLGLPFPPGMRAGDDDLDALWELADPDAFPVGYLAERHQAVARFRQQNQAAVRHLSAASGGSWRAFYDAARRQWTLRGLLLLVLLGPLIALHAHGHRHLYRTGGELAGLRFGLLWLIGCAAAAYILQVTLRGSFDMSSVNHRESFIRFTLTLGAAVTTLGLLVHLLIRRSLRALAWDLGMLSLAGTLLCILHPLVFGWHLGFPVPPPPVYFFPYFGALFLGALNVVALLFCGFGWASQGWLKLSGTLERTRQDV